jgi:hypothetical protein
MKMSWMNLFFAASTLLLLSCTNNEEQSEKRQEVDNSSAEIKISADFDKGSIGSLKKVSENLFRGQTMHWIKKDGIGDQYNWFYFQIVNVKGRQLTFQLDNMKGIYRNNPIEHFADFVQPVLSYDNDNWERIRSVSYEDTNKTFTFNVRFTQDTAWIAFAHPYTLKHGTEFLESVKSNRYVKSEKIGESVEGRAIELLKIINHERAAENKKKILILSLQHGSEDCGGYFTEGLVNFLLSDSASAAKLRDNFEFYIVPVMNPDGIYHGISRYSVAMEDLNVEWDDDISDTENLPIEPEVLAVKNRVKKFYEEGNAFDLFIDVHSQSQKWYNNAFWDKGGDLEKLVEINSQSWIIKHFTPKSRQWNGSAAGFFNYHLNVPSATLELTQSYTGDFNYLTIEDYRFYGAEFAKSILEFFETK